MNPSMDVNVAPREVVKEDAGGTGAAGAPPLPPGASASSYSSPYPYPYSGRPIIMIGDIAKDLSNLCVRPAALHEAEAEDYYEDDGNDNEQEEERGWALPIHRRHLTPGSILPGAAAGAAVDDDAPPPHQPQHLRYPRSDDFSQNSMSDVSVDEIFNEVPHILEGYGRAAAALAAAEESAAAATSSWSRGVLPPSRRSAAQVGPGLPKGSRPSSQLHPHHHDHHRRRSSSIDIDRVDDWIVEPVDIAVVKTGRGCSSSSAVPSPPPASSPLHPVQFTETTAEETESLAAHSQTPSFYGDEPSPMPSRRRPTAPRFPSEEILYQSERRPPPPPPPPVDFTSAYEALTMAGGIAGSLNNNNDRSSSTHLQRSAISQPSTLSTGSDWAALGAAPSADNGMSSPLRTRRRSSGHSGMVDNELYYRQPSFEPSASDESPMGGGGGAYGFPATPQDRGSESRRQPTLDHEYQQLACGPDELRLLQRSCLPPPSPRLQDRGFGVLVHEHVSSTLARSPPSPPPPAPPLPQHRAPPPRVPSPPPSLLPTPPKDGIVIEVAPGEFLPLRGSHETLKAIEEGLGQQVTCMACGALLTCINDCLMVICPDCRCVSQTPHENDPNTVWVRMEDGEPSTSSSSHANGSGNGSSHNHSSSSSSRQHGGGGGGADWWERGAEEEESESSFLGGFAARHRQEATRRRANVMAISTRAKHGVGLGLKVAEH